tara:strand:- start:1712 stop:3478 length:1767 start_codon:yes stop_codon:yes gene_type:complete
MARKINLKGLFNSGDLTHILNGSQDSISSNGVASMFDGLTTTGLVINQTLGNPTQTFNFASPILCNKLLIKIRTRETDINSISLNGQTASAQSALSISSDSSVISTFTFNANNLNSLRIEHTNAFGNDHFIFGIEIFILEESNSVKYEFNDSVLTTKAWNSSRYDGRQLSGSKLNKFTAGDSSYGLTPVISNLTRTFYISSDITSLNNTGLRINRLSGDEEEDTENPIEDPSLQYIPDFSYIVVNKSITINKDNSIKITDLSTFNASPGGTNRRTGFNREFQTNIPNGSYIGLKNLDASVKDRSDISYRVYFNAGRLQPIARFINDFSVQDIAGSTTLSKSLKFAVSDTLNQGGSFTIQNRKKVRQFFTGSIQPKTVNGTAVGPSYNEFKSFFGAMSAYRNTNVSKPRFFFSLLNTLGETAPANPLAKDIEVIRTVSSESGFFPTENLAELSTAEITSNGEDLSNFILGGSSTFNLNQNYTTEVTTNEVTDPDTGGTITIIAGGSSPLLFSGSYDISFLNENKPSLLVNLNKEIEFPDGIGRTPLVIIPENLHPYIKDNIPQFMARAGFDIGNITQINALDETNQTLS